MDDYKLRLEEELLNYHNGGADMYLWRNNPPTVRIVEALDPPEGGGSEAEK